MTSQESAKILLAEVERHRARREIVEPVFAAAKAWFKDFTGPDADIRLAEVIEAAIAAERDEL